MTGQGRGLSVGQRRVDKRGMYHSKIPSVETQSRNGRPKITVHVLFVAGTRPIATSTPSLLPCPCQCRWKHRPQYGRWRGQRNTASLVDPFRVWFGTARRSIFTHAHPSSSDVDKDSLAFQMHSTRILRRMVLQRNKSAEAGQAVGAMSMCCVIGWFVRVGD